MMLASCGVMDMPLPPTEKAFRLKAAREKHFKSAMQAAEAMGISYGTYSGHESGSRGFGDKTAARYAKFFRVPVDWLVLGIGSMTRTNVVPIVGLVGLGGEIQWDEDGHVHLGEVELPFSLPPGCFALEAKGDSQHPRVKDGEVVITRWHEGAVRDLIGREAVVELSDKRYLLKVIRRGTEADLYHLESHNAGLIEDVEISRAGPVMMIMPSREWVRL